MRSVVAKWKRLSKGCTAVDSQCRRMFWYDDQVAPRGLPKSRPLDAFVPRAVATILVPFVGLAPAEPQLVSLLVQAIAGFRAPSGSSRRSHNWSATVRP